MCTKPSSWDANWLLYIEIWIVLYECFVLCTRLYGPVLLTHAQIEIRTWMGNYIHRFTWLITYQCPNPTLSNLKEGG